MNETPEEALSSIHYSWFIPFLEPFCDSDKALILCAFSRSDKAKLYTHFELNDHKTTISDPAKRFFTFNII